MKQKIIFVILMLALANTSFAQEDMVKAGITPGNAFYGLDRALEKIHLMLTVNEVKEAKLHLKFAEERLSELNEIVKKNKTKYIYELVEKHDKHLQKAQAKIEKAQEKGKNIEDVAYLVAQVTSKHIEVLQRVLEKVPEQAKPYIEHAIEVSQKSHEQAVESIEKEKGKPEEVPRAKVREITEEEPEEIEEAEEEVTKEEQEVEETKPKKEEKGKLIMQITDKPAINITKLEITISSIKVHTSAQAIDYEECVEETYEEEECHNETIVNEICTNITAPKEVCINETFYNETCTDPQCINGTFINDTCVNGTFIPRECINESYIKEICHNETIVINETCVNETTIKEICENVTKTRIVCTNKTGGGTAGWKTILDGEKIFDLISIKNVKEFLGETELEPAQYTQIRLLISSANLEVGNVSQTLKIPSETIKLTHQFTINPTETTTLTLDFDAEESVHKAGSKYILKPTIKVIEE